MVAERARVDLRVDIIKLRFTLRELQLGRTRKEILFQGIDERVLLVLDDLERVITRRSKLIFKIDIRIGREVDLVGEVHVAKGTV